MEQEEATDLRPLLRGGGGRAVPPVGVSAACGGTVLCEPVSESSSPGKRAGLRRTVSPGRSVPATKHARPGSGSRVRRGSRGGSSSSLSSSEPGNPWGDAGEIRPEGGEVGVGPPIVAGGLRPTSASFKKLRQTQRIYGAAAALDGVIGGARRAEQEAVRGEGVRRLTRPKSALGLRGGSSAGVAGMGAGMGGSAHGRESRESRESGGGKGVAGMGGSLGSPAVERACRRPFL